MTFERFAIRAYVFLLNQAGRVLISNETYKGMAFTKFPGGGIELGESITNGLKREVKEELDISQIKLDHVYTCDFVVRNQFNESDQVVGVYYQSLLTKAQIEKVDQFLAQSKMDGTAHLLSREWIAPEQLKSRLTFEMDRKAANVFCKNISS